MNDEAKTIAEIEARHANRKAEWQSYGALHPLDDGPVIDDTDDLLAIVKRQQEREAALAYFLRIYIHAHEHGASVPPNIDGDARKALAGSP